MSMEFHWIWLGHNVSIWRGSGKGAQRKGVEGTQTRSSQIRRISHPEMQLYEPSELMEIHPFNCIPEILWNLCQCFGTYHNLFGDQHMPFEWISWVHLSKPRRQVATWLSNGSTLARWSASVNQAGPISFSSCGVNGILMPQNSPSACSPTTWAEWWVWKVIILVKEMGEVRPVEKTAGMTRVRL